MTGKQKIAIGAGTLVVLGIIAFLVYRMLWKDFVNIGDSRYLPTRFNDARLGLQMKDKNHGIKVGDSVDITHDNDATAKGHARVLDIVEKGGLPFIITNLKAPYTNPDVAGKVRVTS